MRRNYPLIAIALVLTTSLFIFPAANQPVKAQTAQPLPFQYAVKFICGKSSSRGEPEIVARGTYFTAINVHNPLVEKVEFRKKFAIPIPGEDTPLVSKFFPAELPGDGALDISCLDIAKLLNVTFASFEVGNNARFLTGFVVIESRTELDVIAVYTAAGSGGFFGRGQIETMTLERVPVRRLGQPDLIPVPDANSSFCRRDSAGRLIVTIKNQGAVDAPGSVTRLDFSSGENVAVTTPAIPAGTSVDVFAIIPASCFTPECTFRIAVDSTGVVSEFNEGNNAAGGTCSSR